MEDDKKAPAEAKVGGATDDVADDDVTDEGNKGNPPAKEGNKGGAPETPKPEKKQSREEDAYYASLRKQGQAKPESKQLNEEQIRRQAEFDVKKGLVSQSDMEALGLEKIETPDDLYLAEKFAEGKKNGEENPEKYAYQQLRAKTKADAAVDAEKAANAAKAHDAVAKDQKDFEDRFHKHTWDIFNDPENEFMKLFGSQLKPGNFTELYAIYDQMKNTTDVADAKGKGTFPTGGGGNPGGKNTPKTDEEFKREFDKKYRS